MAWHEQVGNDFSANFTAATPFPAGMDATKRIPWPMSRSANRAIPAMP